MGSGAFSAWMISLVSSSGQEFDVKASYSVDLRDDPNRGRCGVPASILKALDQNSMFLSRQVGRRL